MDCKVSRQKPVSCREELCILSRKAESRNTSLQLHRLWTWAWEGPDKVLPGDQLRTRP